MRYRTLTPLLLLATSVVAAQERPNIILFLVDDMGVMDSSVPMLTDERGEAVRYPLNDWFRTPNMEHLAAQGVRFERFYAQSVSSPTRASLMTGQNSARHGVTQWINGQQNNRGEYGPSLWRWEGLNSDMPTLPRMLSEAGYKSITVGKAHFGAAGYEGADPLNIGFDVNIAGSSIGSPGSYLGEENYSGKRSKVNAVQDLEAYHGTDTFLSEALTIEAKKQIDIALEEQKPFFLYMSHYAAHTPFSIDKRFIDNYDGTSRHKMAAPFAAIIEGMDDALGELMDHLAQRDIAENTFIIFVGDNGTTNMSNDVKSHDSAYPLRGMKGTEYEGGVRVPFIASWGKPNNQSLNIASGEIMQQLGTVMDIYPTILSIADVALPESYAIDGYDLTTQLAGEENAARKECVLMHFPHEHRGSYYTTFIEDGWKLIYRYNPDSNSLPQYELYNLKSDPFERDDIAKKHPERLQELCRAMVAELEREGALYPEKEDGTPITPIIPTL